MRPFLLLALLGLLTGSGAYAQSVTVSGTIRDQDTDEPLIGVNVQLEGTTTGVATGLDGSFSLNLSREEAETGTLLVSYIGYKTQRVSDLDGVDSPLIIRLERDIIRGDEVVVTGQGINMERRRLSTNVVSVTAREIERSPVQRLDQLLQSNIPNAQFRLTNGQPGSSSTIQARGVVSAFTNSTPIVYVDGVRVDNLNTAAALGGGASSGAATSSLADIPTENIERIEYINGGAATTLYGSDAANGVIQVFTRKRGSGRPQVTFDAQVGATAPTTDFLHFDRTADLLYQTGRYQDYTVSFSGGGEQFGYSVSGSVTDDAGFRINNQNENRKATFRSGFSARLSDRFRYESSLAYAHSTFGRVRNGNAGGYTGLWYTESGSSLFVGPGFNPNLDELSNEAFSRMKEFVDRAEGLQDNRTRVNRFQTAQSVEFTPSPAWLVRGTVGLDYRVLNEEIITTNEYLNHVDDVSGGDARFDRGEIEKFNRSFLGLTTELTARHEFNTDQLSFVTTFGGQLFRDEDRQVAYTGTNVRDGALSISQAASTESDEFLSEVVNYGLYVQENVGFRGRYFIEFGLRGDGNSAFGEEVGTQLFPKVGASYVLSSEPRLAGVFDGTLISYAKMKANYGVAGNFPTPFANERTVAFDGFIDGQAATFGQPGNPDLKPEKTHTYEGGLDIGLFNDRLLLNAGYYYSETRDALFFVPLAPSVGEGTQLSNVGTIENKGWEFALSAQPISNQDWDVRINASFNTLSNEVVNAGGAGAFNINGFSARTIQTVVEEGYPVGYLRGNKSTFEDGVMVSTEPLSFLGSTIPEYFGSLSMDATFRGVRLFANADYQMGAYAHSFDRQFRFLYGASSDFEGVPASEVDANGTDNWLNITDRFVEKTDFLKFRTIGISYTLDGALLDGIVKRATVGFTVVNPLNFASSSFDPEATQSGADQGQDSATTGGIAYAAESAPRRFIGRLTLNF
jgi:outer membrane receptor protein involved in Fe transport